MVFKVNDISDDLKLLLMDLYSKNVSLDELIDKYKVSRNTLLSLFTYNNIDYKKEDAVSFKINGNKVLIISDTHIGSNKENLNYIDKSLEEGLKQGVSACLHLGDLIQGEYSKINKPITYQLNTLKDFYPKINEFNTYLLLGNHDYSVFESNNELKEFLLSLKKFVVLGYKKAYFDWNNYLYSMEHKVKLLNDEMMNEDIALSFVGHGHELKIKSSSRLKAPTLSDDIINKTNGAYPGFLIANLDSNYLYVDAYGFKKNKVILKKNKYFEKNMIDKYKVR